MGKAKEIIVALTAAAAAGTAAACGTGPSAEDIARQQAQRAAFDAAQPITLEVGGAPQILPIADLGKNTPPAYSDQFCGGVGPSFSCGRHNFVYDDGRAIGLIMNGSITPRDGTPDCKTIYTRKSGTLDSGEPGPVKALVAVVPDRPRRQLTARVLTNGTIEICDVVSQSTPDPNDWFKGSPVVVFVKDPVTKAASLRSPDSAVTPAGAPSVLAARRRAQAAARTRAVI